MGLIIFIVLASIVGYIVYKVLKGKDGGAVVTDLKEDVKDDVEKAVAAGEAVKDEGKGA